MGGLIPSVKSNLPVSTQDDSTFEDMSNSSDFLQRIKLYSKGKAVDKGMIKGGQWGVPVSDEKIDVLGEKIDVIVLARRAKAMNFSDRDNIVSSYDSKSEAFKEIQRIAESKQQDTGCVFGISFLVYERNTKKFYEYFASSATARRNAGELYPYLPAKQEEANPELEYYTPATMGSRYIEKGDYSWFGPTTDKCSTPVDMPSEENLTKQLERFLNPEVSKGAEKVSKEEKEAATGGRAR